MSRTMSSKSSENLLSMKVYKAILDAEANSKESYLETVHLHQDNILPSNHKWFKGSRDRGLRGDLAA